MTRFVRSPIADGKVPTIEASSKILLIHHHPHWIVKTETNHKNGRSFPNQIRIFPRVEVSLPFQKAIFAKGASLEIYCTGKIWKVLYNAVAGSRKSYKPTTILHLLLELAMGYCTQSTPFQASEKQGTAVGLEIGGGYVYPICFDMFCNPFCKKPKKGCTCTGLRNMSKHVLTQQEMYFIRLGKELRLL